MNFKVLTYFALIVLMSQTISAVSWSQLRHFMPRSNLGNDQTMLDAPIDYQGMTAQDLEYPHFDDDQSKFSKNLSFIYIFFSSKSQNPHPPKISTP